MAKRELPIGIDDMAFYVPKIYLDIEELAEKRGIDPNKLKFGLGLHKMALPDAHEDAATMAAEAIFELFERVSPFGGKNNLDPRRVGRIYLGTESALDGAKPTATYALDMVKNRLAERHGSDCFRHCDVVDMTFACVGAVDALHNCLDWVAGDPENVAIVVASDLAKYELASTGEYTQGAGAVAMLVRWHPKLLKIRNLWGVATESVHDFFKPRRRFDKKEMVADVLNSAGIFNGEIEKIHASMAAENWQSPLRNGEPTVEIFREMPVFDGQFSNQCYQDRMVEALAHFRKKAVAAGVFSGDKFRGISDRWARMVFHLPYSFHGKRIYVEQFVFEMKEKGVWADFAKKMTVAEPQPTDFSEKKLFEKAKMGWLKSVSESPVYQKFVALKLEKAQRASSEVGNLYTGSIFLALMGTLEADFLEKTKLSGKRIGFVAYGSGSKSKVFEAQVMPSWAEKAAGFQIAEKLENRRAVSYSEYEALHTGRLVDSLDEARGSSFGLQRIENQGVIAGARYYGH